MSDLSRSAGAVRVSRRSLLAGTAAGVVAAVTGPGTAHAGVRPVAPASADPPRRLWQLAFPALSRVAAADGYVYATGKPHLMALDARTGTPRWTTTSMVWRDQLVADGRFVAVRADSYGPDHERLAAHDAATGALVWSDKDGRDRIAGLDDGGLLLYGTDPAFVRRVDLTDGRDRWRVQAGAQFVHRVRGGVVAGDARGTVRLDSASGAPQWTVRPGEFAVGAVSADGVWLTGHGDLAGTPFAIRRVDARTGAQAWSIPTPGGSSTMLMADAGDIVAVAEHGRIVGRDAATGAPRWEVDAARLDHLLVCGDLLWMASWPQVRVTHVRTGAPVDVPDLPSKVHDIAAWNGIVVIAAHDELTAFGTTARTAAGTR